MILPLHSKPEEEFDVTRGIVPAGSLTFKMEMKMNEMRLCSYRIAPDIFVDQNISGRELISGFFSMDVNEGLAQTIAREGPEGHTGWLRGGRSQTL